MDRPEHPAEHRFENWHRTQGMSIGPPVTPPRKFLQKSRRLWTAFVRKFSHLEAEATRRGSADRRRRDVGQGSAAESYPRCAPADGRRARGDLGITESSTRARTLFFVHECSHQDVATFLGLLVATVNNRLHAARLQLKQRMLTTMTNILHANALPDDFANRIERLIESRRRRGRPVRSDSVA